jgi:hypothetical protein
MLFDLTFPCYLTTFSGKKGLKREGYLCFFPAYRSSPVIVNGTINVPTSAGLIDSLRPVYEEWVDHPRAVEQEHWMQIHSKLRYETHASK